MSQEVGEITHLPAMDPNFLVHPSRGFVSTVDLWFLFSSQAAFLQVVKFSRQKSALPW